MKKITLVVLTLVAGCASAPDCGSDWRNVGANEGRIGARPQRQTEAYSASCPGKFDEARYMEGWRESFAQRPIPLW
jgi:hypothetical protein